MAHEYSKGSTLEATTNFTQAQRLLCPGFRACGATIQKTKQIIKQAGGQTSEAISFPRSRWTKQTVVSRVAPTRLFRELRVPGSPNGRFGRIPQEVFYVHSWSERWPYVEASSLEQDNPASAPRRSQRTLIEQ